MSIIEEINNMMMIWEIKNFRREWVARYIAGLEARLENVELPPKEQVEADQQRWRRISSGCWKNCCICAILD